MKKLLIIVSIILIGTGVVYSAPPASINYVGTILPVEGDDKNDIGTSTNQFRKLYLSKELTSTGTTATSTFLGNVMIGNALFNGQLDISSFGTDVASFQVSENMADFAKVVFANTSDSANNLMCNIYNNGRSTRAGVASSYYGGLCFAGHNYNVAGFDGVKPNGMAVFASDGDLSLGSASMNAASSSIRFFVGGNAAAFSAAGQDMVLQGGTGYLGIGTTTPRDRLHVQNLFFSNPTSGSLSIGGLAGRDSRDTALGNVFLGQNAGRANTEGDRNVAIGQSAFLLSTAGNDNVALGQQALYRLTSGNSNFAMGRDSLRLAVGSGNIAIGYRAAYGLNVDYSASYNVFIGRQVGYNSSSAPQFNTCIGDTSCTGDVDYGLTGNRNTALGTRTGYTIGSGEYNILIGNASDVIASTTSRFLNIGSVLFGTNMYNGTTENSTPVAEGTIGIGTTTPYAKLSVNTDSSTMVAFDVSTSTGKRIFTIDSYGHEYTGGTVPTVTSCGTSPSLEGDDSTFRVKIGSGGITSCTVNFANAWKSSPMCIADEESSPAGIHGIVASSTKTSVVINHNSATSDEVWSVMCRSSHNFTY